MRVLPVKDPIYGGVRINALWRGNDKDVLEWKVEGKRGKIQFIPRVLAVNTLVSYIYDTDQYPIPIPLYAGNDPDPRKLGNSLRSRVCCKENMWQVLPLGSW